DRSNAATGTPRNLPRDDDEQRREEAAERLVGERLGKDHAALGGHGRRDADEERCPPPNVSVAVLPPRADDGRRQEREQRRPGRDVLRQPPRHGRWDEENSSPDAEHPGEDSGSDTEDNRERDRHFTNNQIAMPMSRAAKSSSIVRVRIRCCKAVPPNAPAAAGTPTSAAYMTFTSPCNAYVITPDSAVIPIAASDLAVALRASQWQTSSSSGTMTSPPPTPNSALKKPATRPMRTSRTAVS